MEITQEQRDLIREEVRKEMIDLVLLFRTAAWEKTQKQYTNGIPYRGMGYINGINDTMKVLLGEKLEQQREPTEEDLHKRYSVSNSLSKNNYATEFEFT